MRSIRILAAITILAGVCLAGCGRGSSAGTEAEAFLPAKPAAAAINGGDVEHFIYGVRDDLDNSSFWRMGDDVEHLNQLPPAGLSKGLSLQRTREINDLEAVLLSRWASRLAASLLASLPPKAAEVISDQAAEVPERFQESLTEVTEDALRGVACRAISNLATVVIEPDTANQPDDENWRGDIVEAAERILGGTLSFYIGQSMSWASWGSEVNEFAGQVSDDITNDPPAYLNILSKPQGQRAAWAYLKYCYAPPFYQGA